MWLETKEMSDWAYSYCKYVKDDPEVRKNITDSYWAYLYCLYIQYRPEVRKYIKEGECG